DLRFEIVGRIEKEIIDAGNVAGDFIVFYALQNDRSEPLVECGDLADFPLAQLRVYGLVGDDEYYGVRLPDEVEKLMAPFRQGGKVARVDLGFDAALFEGSHKLLREYFIDARIGDKHIERSHIERSHAERIRLGRIRGFMMSMMRMMHSCVSPRGEDF